MTLKNAKHHLFFENWPILFQCHKYFGQPKRASATAEAASSSSILLGLFPDDLDIWVNDLIDDNLFSVALDLLIYLAVDANAYKSSLYWGSEMA